MKLFVAQHTGTQALSYPAGAPNASAKLTASVHDPNTSSIDEAEIGW